MAEAPNILGQGMVDETDEVIYTVPGSTSAIVTVVVVNVHSSTTVTGIILRANGTGDSNIIAKVSELAAGEQMRSGPWALGAADTLRLETVTGDDVAAYTVEGIEFT